jgi:hypothetical protein
VHSDEIHVGNSNQKSLCALPRHEDIWSSNFRLIPIMIQQDDGPFEADRKVVFPMDVSKSYSALWDAASPAIQIIRGVFINALSARGYLA